MAILQLNEMNLVELQDTELIQVEGGDFIGSFNSAIGAAIGAAIVKWAWNEVQDIYHLMHDGFLNDI